jgi:Zinc knuckle
VIVPINFLRVVETAGEVPRILDPYNSDEDHVSKDCPNPLTAEYLATITCRRCEQPGHLSADCPEKPKFTCNNCGQEGHKRSECTVRLTFYLFPLT